MLSGYCRDSVTQDQEESSVFAIYVKMRELRAASAGTFSKFGLWLSLVERLVRDFFLRVFETFTHFRVLPS
jgi:hypothetical protein